EPFAPRPVAQPEPSATVPAFVPSVPAAQQQPVTRTMPMPPTHAPMPAPAPAPTPAPPPVGAMSSPLPPPTMPARARVDSYYPQHQPSIPDEAYAPPRRRVG